MPLQKRKTTPYGTAKIFLNRTSIKTRFLSDALLEQLHCLTETAVFLLLDARSGYCQIEIEKSNRDETRFTLLFGIFLFIRGFYGL